MLSYNNDPAMKEKLIASLEAHRVAEHLIRNTYGVYIGTENRRAEDRKQKRWTGGVSDNNGTWKGCAIGCSLEALTGLTSFSGVLTPHEKLGALIQIPPELLELEDAVFEASSWEYAQIWPVRFATALPVGKVLTKLVNEIRDWINEHPDLLEVDFELHRERFLSQMDIDTGAVEALGDKIIELLEEVE